MENTNLTTIQFAQGVFGIKKNKDNTFAVLRHDNGKVSECHRDCYYIENLKKTHTFLIVR